MIILHTKEILVKLDSTLKYNLRTCENVFNNSSGRDTIQSENFVQLCKDTVTTLF